MNCNLAELTDNQLAAGMEMLVDEIQDKIKDEGGFICLPYSDDQGNNYRFSPDLIPERREALVAVLTVQGKIIGIFRLDNVTLPEGYTYDDLWDVGCRMLIKRWFNMNA